ncbi:MAG: hypothetical protein AAB414_04475 [Patescibacteria group bacterium]
MKKNKPTALKQAGVSLIESLMIIVVVSAVVMLLVNLPNAMNLVQKSKHLSLAREIAAKQIEDKRSINYINLVNSTTNITGSEDLRMNSLPNSSGQVLVEDCDPSICTNNEHIKKVTVTINWKDNNKYGAITLKTLIGEGGLNQ